MKIRNFLWICFVGIISCTKPIEKNSLDSFKGVLNNRFYIGTALSNEQLIREDNKILREAANQFNAIVPENCMKSALIHPQKEVYNFTLADRFIEYGLQHDMWMTGHTLIWHSQTPDWFFKDSNGNEVKRDELIHRMKDHITTLVHRYKDFIKGWDVVNEAIEDDGSYRETKFYKIIGPEYINLAFKFAREADPKAELYYNDYSMTLPEKRAGVIRMIRALQRQGIRVDGIGMQGHVNLTSPSIEAFENSIVAYADLGVKVMITEFDISVLPFPNEHLGADINTTVSYKEQLNPYKEKLPDTIQQKFNDRCFDFFKLFLKYDKAITRVTVWGVSDEYSWKNDWPITGRTDYPLLIGRNHKPKEILKQLTTYVANK
ncbi:beta-xylanase [Neptunitalea chrysea]|uniref:Beta-xylanase n=1 Tax=Neptunitalea chrysea TaxID=1647581 RepID=A0A9W6B3L8_9FLAO|nr:endo-1,4-beta-xylanase [Neptunitalea chrysea]GLB51866.1 beta-xylanase [Neptunitalea chrysea]